MMCCDVMGNVVVNEASLNSVYRNPNDSNVLMTKLVYGYLAIV